jgi:EpsI family protein
MQTGSWKGQEFHLSDFTLDVLKATTTASRDYRDTSGQVVSLFIGYFEDQKYGSQIHSPRHCLPGGGWGILESHEHEFEFAGDRIRANRVVIGNEKSRQIVYYWFRTRSGVLSNEYALKFDLVLNSLRFRPTDAALIRVVADAPGGEEELADRAIADFLAEVGGSVEKSLPF